LQKDKAKKITRKQIFFGIETMKKLLSADHIRQIREHGLTEAQALEQIQRFKSGATPIRLNRPCTVGDGVSSLSAQDGDALVKRHDEAAARGRFMKFVPASGAASRMFREWFRCLESGRFDTDAAAKVFAAELRKFAFCEDLERLIARKGSSLDDWLAQHRHGDILAAVLLREGLNYGRLPKALLKFHAYPDGSRTAIEEHLVEAALYVKDRDGTCRLHFSVSAEHRQDVEACLSNVMARYADLHRVNFDVGVSIQSAATDTLAVDPDNRPFVDETGRLVLRPGGHGALLANLNLLSEADIVFLKNIDNVVPDALKAPTVLYKKVLGGCLIALQDRIFQYLRRLAGRPVSERELDSIVSFCRETLHIGFPPGFSGASSRDRQARIFSKLNRPLRVCGMVKNEGEPGGGPFWTDGVDGTQSLQIVEESQIDGSASGQRDIWNSATHFNPVDLVCGVRDYQGRKHDLQQFVDFNAFSIALKSEKGRDLRALELPGLWNGSMADWITIFVEVPIETFNPVKTVYDLLRPAHTSARTGSSL
jgi:hypothetical protein